MQLGLSSPDQMGAAPIPAFSQQSAANPTPQQINIGGITSMRTLGSLQAEEATAAAVARATEAGNTEVVQGLVSYLRKHWTQARDAKIDVEQQMLEAVRARSGRYSAAKEAELARNGGSAIYMMLFATKARQAKALLTDVMVGSGVEKPWTFAPSPKPDLPPHDVQQVVAGVQQIVAQAELAGQGMGVDEIRALLQDAKDRLEHTTMAQAKAYSDKAERTIEDVLVEGGYQEALNEFLDDLTVFKTAFLKGPVVRNQPILTWEMQPGGAAVPAVTTTKKMCWERVDPFMMYPAAWAKTVEDAYLIERHRLSRADLSAMIGVDGYSEDAIRAVLDAHGAGGLHDWLQVDSDKAAAESREPDLGDSELIDALQCWDSVSGKMLREWGMKGVTDDAKEYPVECWLIGQWVIKCVINPDPLARRPYYCDGYSRVPGAFWHKSLFDLIRDCVDMCNAAARALANNLGISSGPQVGVNVDRMPPGEEITEMYPWKIWQFSSDPMGSSAPPITFFQPGSNASELMGVYDKFSLMADEYSGIPRYMTGTEGTPGAGRTASGLSMMVGNASKVIKALVSSLDIHVTQPALRRAFDFKVQYDPTFEYQGDLQIVARGALSLQVKEAANQARMQFLQATANPLDAQIIGIEGRAAVLRAIATSLNLNTDSVVPSMSAMKVKQAQAVMAQQQAAQAPQQPGQQPAPPSGPQSGQVLSDGSPITDNFSQQPQ